MEQNNWMSSKMFKVFREGDKKSQNQIEKINPQQVEEMYSLKELIDKGIEFPEDKIFEVLVVEDYSDNGSAYLSRQSRKKLKSDDFKFVQIKIASIR